MYRIEAAHNPEVAGSNPAPATEKGPGNRVFLLERIVFGLLHLQAVVGYLTESPGFNTFARDDGARLPHLLDDLEEGEARQL